MDKSETNNLESGRKILLYLKSTEKHEKNVNNFEIVNIKEWHAKLFLCEVIFYPVDWNE